MIDGVDATAHHRRPRRGPNRLEFGPETTHALVRSRVDGVRRRKDAAARTSMACFSRMTSNNSRPAASSITNRRLSPLRPLHRHRRRRWDASASTGCKLLAAAVSARNSGRRRNGLASSVFTATVFQKHVLPPTDDGERASPNHVAHLKSAVEISRCSQCEPDRSSIRPLELLPSLPCSSVGGAAVSRSGDPDATPRGRFGSGARASLQVARGPAGASRRRGGPKAHRAEPQALRPSFKSWSGVREPRAAGASGRGC